MAYKAVSCPNCGAAITSIPDRGSFFCQYCGSKIEREKLHIEVSGNVTVGGMASETSLLERAYLFLEDEDYESADAYFERVLDINPECSKAYIGKILVKNRHRNTSEFLRHYHYQIDRLDLFQKALRFANDDEYDELMALKQANINQHEQNMRNIQININQSTKHLNELNQYYAIHKYTNNKYSFMVAIVTLLMIVAVFGILFGVLGIFAAGAVGLVFIIPCGAAVYGLCVWNKDIKKKRAEGIKLEAEKKRWETIVQQSYQAKQWSEEKWNGYDR